MFYIETEWPVGGSQIMFIELGSYIAEHNSEYDVYYVNHKHPDLEKLYASPKLKIVDVETCNPKDFEGSLFITPYNYTFELMVRFGEVEDIRVLLFYYHQEIMTWLDNQMSSPVIDMHPYLELINEKDAYCFMDGSCFISIYNRLKDIPFSRRYLPVPIKVKGKVNPAKLINNGKINIGWLGRLDRDKVYSVINLADNLLEANFAEQIDFHIIGDGNSKGLINPNDYSPKIRLIFTSNLYGDTRDQYIRDNIDIMVAMGMSATDSSQLGVPVAFPIVSPSRFYDNKYIYLFDTKEYAIGWDPVEIGGSNCPIHTIEEIVEDIYEKGKKEEYSNKCYDVAVHLFSPSNCVSLLLPIAEKTRLTIGDCLKCKPIKRLMRRYRVYSLIAKEPSYKNFHNISRRLRFDVIRNMGLINAMKGFAYAVIRYIRRG